MGEETYNTKVYNLQGGEVTGVKSDGYYNIGGESVLAQDVRKVIVSEQAIQLITPLALNSVLHVSNLPKNVKVVKILGSDATINASFWLTSVSAGREVYLHLCGDAAGAFINASTLVDVSCSGCIVLGSVGAVLSGFEMHTSIASDCGVHLVAVADDVWAIVSQFGDINE